MKMIVPSMALGLALLWCGRTGAQTTVTDGEIRKLLRDQVEHLQSPGIVVGLIDAHGSKILAYGKTAREGGVDVDGDTVFEIGSMRGVHT
jgi:CubicO group peptidase (beta-lactamase class C family)